MIKLDWKLVEERFYVSLSGQTDAICSIPAAELLQPERAKSFVDRYGEAIGALEPAAAAAYFGGWFSGVAHAMQYAVSVCNVSLHASLAALTIQMIHKENRCALCFRLQDGTVLEAPEGDHARSEWRSTILTAFYRDTVRPLFEAVAAAAGCDVGQLWGQLPSRMANQTEQWRTSIAGEDVRSRIAADVLFLKDGLDPVLLNRVKSPFDVKLRYVESIKDKAQNIALKSSCCMHYRTGSGVYCYTCPRLTEKQRAERLAGLRSAEAVKS
ncbi:hypothetical protein ACFQI7_20205 [Paenibacillus allorhizosphaerae]|uniref:Ferric siderophore reductase C-terminal domain-containing protein n=1 Tax=Paenibacillus allorhizosphaerae TaxID=2849866 RepID=A0ABN7TQZ9_9BACL|nr:(2Fe-2S)-binding protein [Paenibacillus allorhizosphaerae]CAG7647458.1 hypothetical protein PAECIP111802_03979 [Paenibacillus allorhizosphaerae]